MGVIDRRRTELQQRALREGSQLYERSPKRFVKALRREGRKRAWAQDGASA